MDRLTSRIVRSVLVTTFALTGCISTPSRVPSSLGRLQEVAATLEIAKQQVLSPDFTAETCSTTLNNIQRNLNLMNWQDYSNAELTEAGDNLITRFWEMRLEVHRHLDVMTPECLSLARGIFHTARDHEDYLGDMAYRVQSVLPANVNFQKGATPIYDKPAYWPMLVRSDVNSPKFQFHSGDLMLARGISFFSALISQLSDNKSTFSHVVFINEDDKSGKLNTVESYIGVGVKSYDMDFALKNENTRLLVLRPKDSTLADKAAKYAMTAAQRRVPYDYEMNDNDYSRMSCVEVARYSFDKASQGKVILPQAPAKLELKNKDFLNKISLKNGSMVTPDDLETDSRFELLLDWRDYRLLRDSRRKDAVLFEIVRWMEEMNYKFHDTTKSRLAKDVLLPLRRTILWPLVRNMTNAPDIDPQFPRKTLGVMTVLNQVAEDTLARIYEVDQQYIEEFGRPMTNQQLRGAINKLREEDLQNYKKGRKTFIHYAFRP